jgi:hypothetical protein
VSWPDKNSSHTYPITFARIHYPSLTEGSCTGRQKKQGVVGGRVRVGHGGERSPATAGLPLVVSHAVVYIRRYLPGDAAPLQTMLDSLGDELD